MPDAVTKPEKFLSIAAVADRLGMNKNTVYKRISEGELTVYKMGPKTYRVKESEVEKFIEKSKVPVGEGPTG